VLVLTGEHAVDRLSHVTVCPAVRVRGIATVIA
jgi:hypothetical protein